MFFHCFFVNFGTQVGSQNALKIDQKIDAFQERFFLDFHGFWEGKWSQVGTKIVSEIDVNFERPICTKTSKNLMCFIVFYGFGEASWDRKSIKN